MTAEELKAKWSDAIDNFFALTDTEETLTEDDFSVDMYDALDKAKSCFDEVLKLADKAHIKRFGSFSKNS